MPKWLQSVDVLFVIIIKLRGAVDVVDRLKGDAVIFGYAFQYTLPHSMDAVEKSEGEVFPRS